jgi:hypothetical protein
MSALAQCDAFGFIYDQAGDPAPDVLVTLKSVLDASGNAILLSPLTTLTDSAGSFHFTLPEDAAATISARASGLWNCPDGRVFKVPPGPTGELIATFLLPGSSSVVPPLIYVSDTLSLPRSSPSADGYLAAADFVRFDAHAADTAGVSTFNLRSGDVLPQAGDYLSFYAPITHTHSRVEITDLGVFSTSQPGLVPQPTSGDAAKVLSGAGTWITPASGGVTLPPATVLVTDFKASGSKQTFLGGITAGSTSLTLTSGTHDFKVGQGISIVGAGALAVIDAGSNLLVSSITAIAGAVITIADAATHTVSGAVVKHDDTVAIQTAITSIWTAGGGTVLFPAGYYRVNNGFTDFNSILKIPKNLYSAAAIPMAFKGEAPAGYLCYAGGVTEKGSAIIHTDLIDTTASMLSGGPYPDGSAAWQTYLNNTCVTMEGLVWRSYENPQISAVDLSACGPYTIVRDVSVDAGTPLLGIGGTPSLSTAVEPTHGTFGLHLPGNSTCILIECTDVAVNSYGIGIVASECVQFNQAIIMQCKAGLRLIEGYHLLTGRFLIWHCPTVIDFTGTLPNVIEFMIDVEESAGTSVGDPAWTVPASNHAFYDPNDTACGKVDYISVQGNTGVLQNVGFTGMSRVTQTNLGGPTKFSAGTLSVPNLQSTSLVANGLNASNGQVTNLIVANQMSIYEGSGVADVTFGADDSAGTGFKLMRVLNTGTPLTSERSDLWNAGAGVEYPLTGTLATGLVSFWNCNAASGPALDSLSINTMDPFGSPGSAGGKIANARPLTGGQYFAQGLATTLSPGDSDFTIAGWFYLTDKTANYYLISKSGSGGDEYILGYDLTTDRLLWTISGGLGYSSIPANSFGSPPLNTWFYVVAWFDSPAEILYIQVNNSVVDSGPTGGVFPQMASGTFYFGSYRASLFFEGRIDAVGYWSRLLT